MTAGTRRCLGPTRTDVVRLSKLQQLLLEYIAERGGDHVYIGRTTVPPARSELSGYTWEGVRLSLRALVKRGVLAEDRSAFYSLTAGAAVVLRGQEVTQFEH